MSFFSVLGSFGNLFVCVFTANRERPAENILWRCISPNNQPTIDGVHVIACFWPQEWNRLKRHPERRGCGRRRYRHSRRYVEGTVAADDAVVFT